MVHKSNNRTILHHKVVQDPFHYLKEAFGVSELSPINEVEKVFLYCAHNTGVSAEQAKKDTRAFCAGSTPPGYVLQYCSARLEEK
jgi:hypothetical protein